MALSECYLVHTVHNDFIAIGALITEHPLFRWTVWKCYRSWTLFETSFSTSVEEFKKNNMRHCYRRSSNSLVFADLPRTQQALYEFKSYLNTMVNNMEVIEERLQRKKHWFLCQSSFFPLSLHAIPDLEENVHWLGRNECRLLSRVEGNILRVEGRQNCDLVVIDWQ